MPMHVWHFQIIFYDDIEMKNIVSHKHECLTHTGYSFRQLSDRLLTSSGPLSATLLKSSGALGARLLTSSIILKLNI